MSTFKEKYIKYKKKYIELKNKMKGGSFQDDMKRALEESKKTALRENIKRLRENIKKELQNNFFLNTKGEKVLFSKLTENEQKIIIDQKQLDKKNTPSKIHFILHYNEPTTKQGEDDFKTKSEMIATLIKTHNFNYDQSVQDEGKDDFYKLSNSDNLIKDIIQAIDLQNKQGIKTFFLFMYGHGECKEGNDFNFGESWDKSTFKTKHLKEVNEKLIETNSNMIILVNSCFAVHFIKELSTSDFQRIIGIGASALAGNSGSNLASGIEILKNFLTTKKNIPDLSITDFIYNIKLNDLFNFEHLQNIILSYQLAVGEQKMNEKCNPIYRLQRNKQIDKALLDIQKIYIKPNDELLNKETYKDIMVGIIRNYIDTIKNDECKKLFENIAINYLYNLFDTLNSYKGNSYYVTPAYIPEAYKKTKIGKL